MPLPAAWAALWAATLSLALTAGFAFGAACLSYFLQWSFEPGRVFGRYGAWLDARAEALGFWYKPLGGCALCMNMWLALAGFWLTPAAWLAWPGGGFLPVWYLAYAMLANYFLRRLLQRDADYDF